MVLPSVPSAMALVLLSGDAAASKPRTVSGCTSFSNITTKLRPPVKSILLLKPRVSMKAILMTANVPKMAKLFLYWLMNLKLGFWNEILSPIAVRKVRLSHLSLSITCA